MITTRLTRVIVASALAFAGLSFAASPVQAGGTACTADISPSSITVYGDDLEASGDLTITATFQSLAYGSTVYAWLGLNGATPAVGEVAWSPFNNETEVTTWPAEAVISLLSALTGGSLEDGEFEVDVFLTDDSSQTYDPSNMLCSFTFTVNFLESSPLPETGSPTGVISLWVIALLGIGAVSVLAASRRRA